MLRVMTGAVMPRGTDTVIIQEICEHRWNRRHPSAARRPGRTAARGRGPEERKPALEAGRLLRPADLGLVASLGIGE